ncbi:uncharacterized protein N7477_003410 [Penicillium maclennaniae]|uniref:uncharacterized protein n=1 Tax=Penicillium maclennaniae TaxID=1343394 RepID=UPI00253FAD4F|nr:uncharacterized protein N7477_003410 [Penicillium maclennaniae]KAJ5677777.1 hypothetical protein N7477_003410 [Penicillium maclennaniae]
MSFFGFDTSLPRDRGRGPGAKGFFENSDPFAQVALADKFLDGDAYAPFTMMKPDMDEMLIYILSVDFEDTYDGLGDQLDDDQDEFNDDTFGGGGGDAAPVGRDFDFFGRTAGVADAIGEEQLPPPATIPTESTSRRTGYEKYSEPGYIPDLQAKSSVWTQKAEPSPAPAPAPAPSRKIMSLEEVEALEAQMRRGQPGGRLPPRQMQQIQQMQQMVADPYQRHPQHFPTLHDGFHQLAPELQAQLEKAACHLHPR